MPKTNSLLIRPVILTETANRTSFFMRAAAGTSVNLAFQKLHTNAAPAEMVNRRGDRGVYLLYTPDGAVNKERICKFPAFS